MKYLSKELKINKISVFFFVIFFVIFLILLYFVFSHSFDYFKNHGDASAYIKMAEGSFDNLSSPHKYRILTPIIIILIPFPIYDSFLIYTSIFLSLTIALSYKFLRKIFSSSIALISILFLFSSELSWYACINPFLVDPLQYSLSILIINSIMNNSKSKTITYLVLGTLNKPISTLFFIPVLFLIYIYRNLARIKKNNPINFSKIKLIVKACLPALKISIIPILLNVTIKLFLGYENYNVIERFRYVWFEYHVKKGVSTIFYRTFQSFTTFLLFSFYGFLIFMRNRHSMKSFQTEKFLILIGWGIFLLPTILITTDIDRMIVSFFPIFLFFSLFCIKEQEYYQSPIFWVLISIRFVAFYFISRISFTIFPILSNPINQLYLIETLLFIFLLVLNIIRNVAIFLSTWKFRNKIFNKKVSDLYNFCSRFSLNRIVNGFNLFKDELISHGVKLKKPEEKDFR